MEKNPDSSQKGLPSNQLKDRAQTLVKQDTLKSAMGQSPDSSQTGLPQTSQGTESRL